MSESGGGEIREWFVSMIGVLANPATSADVLGEFSQLKPGEPQLKFCIKRLQMLGASLNVSSSRVKSNARAREFRNIGNNLFSSNEDTAKVAEMYTKSIAHALPGSRELSLGYANRSAVSFKAGDYEECLLDIERSLDNNYPEEMRAKLHARRLRCLLALEKPQTDIEDALQATRVALLKMDLKASGRNLVEETLTDKNHMAPTLSTKKKHSPLEPPVINDDSCDLRGATGIAIDYSKEYGRHLVATRDIRPGEFVAVIDSYAHVRTPKNCYRNCNHCIEATPYGIPCDHCVNITYCSTSCRDKAWKDYHQYECPILGIMLDLQFPDLVILGIRIALKAVQEAGSVLQLKELVNKIDSVSDPRVKGFTGNVFDGTKYACFTTLANHGGKHPDESYTFSVIATFAISLLATRTDIFGRKYNVNLEGCDKNPLLMFLGGLTIRNCEILVMTCSQCGDDLRIAPLTALCNHSCNSNVICVSAENCVDSTSHQRVMFALQPIKAGEQLWDSYGGLHYSRFSKEERQKLFKSNWFFTCNCVPCTKNWPKYAELPSVFELSGVPPTVRNQLSELQQIFSRTYLPRPENNNMLVARDTLVQMIELLFQHACPCKELVLYRDVLGEMYKLSYNPSQCIPMTRKY